MDGKRPGPGPRNAITDVPGLRVGQAQDLAVRSGVTVILPDERSVCAVDVRGGAPGTRETDALAPENLVDAVDAVVLSGGSVYGLAAADGVVAWLGARGRGYGLVAGIPPSPVVPGAILFDMANGGDKAWGEAPPYRELGRAAVAAAGLDIAQGTVGAGCGAMAGALKGGIGSASVVTDDGFTVGAIVAVNSWGSVIAPGPGGRGRTFWASPFELDGEFGGLGSAGLLAGPDQWGAAKRPDEPRNTTIACVATDAILTPAQARRLAIMAQDGLARAIRPVHAPFDGDVVFALATGRRPLGEAADFVLARLGALAADTLARAVARAVFEARPWPQASIPCWRDLPA
ncbi:P1 family peptidase [Phenylobacterium sp.]|uniref:P1 family peptidase n=1 Tax=Phenylobacterium sp. TaxID=1871053 RepID=UPI0025CD385C|nr:P1 family peptidase [Phenylobacterium sp.]